MRRLRHCGRKRDAEGARFGRCEIDEVAWERVSDATAMLADSAEHAYSTPQQTEETGFGHLRESASELP
jgi:hypothetical protein